MRKRPVFIVWERNSRLVFVAAQAEAFEEAEAAVALPHSDTHPESPQNRISNYSTAR